MRQVIQVLAFAFHIYLLFAALPRRAAFPLAGLQAFWAQSIRLKGRFGWRPPSAADLPARVYQALALTLDRPPDELQMLMDLLIDEWKRQAGAVLTRFGYPLAW